MLKSEVFKYYTDCTEAYKLIYRQIKLKLKEDSIAELCKLRGYTSDGEQYKLLSDMKIAFASSEDSYRFAHPMANELGVATKLNEFLLEDRFIIPVRDVLGNIVALIGYYPDKKKYITTPSPFFSKDVLFFNIDHALDLSFNEYNGVVFVVEGIFDCLSLRSIGLPAVATMGSTVSKAKKEILSTFSKVIYIPDNDAVGRRALNRRDARYGWAVPYNATGLRLSGEVDFSSGGTSEEEGSSSSSVLKIKDIDNLISWFDADTIKEALLSFAESKNEVEDFDLGYVKCS